MAAPRNNSNRLPLGICSTQALRHDAKSRWLDHGSNGDEHRRQADHAVHKGHEFGHFGHLYALRHDGTGAATDHQSKQNPAQTLNRVYLAELSGLVKYQSSGSDDRNRHATHAKQIAANRSGGVGQTF